VAGTTGNSHVGHNKRMKARERAVGLEKKEEHRKGDEAFRELPFPKSCQNSICFELRNASAEDNIVSSSCSSNFDWFQFGTDHWNDLQPAQRPHFETEPIS
jgi:hypothetical protein